MVGAKTDSAPEGEAFQHLRRRVVGLFRQWGSATPEDLADAALERAARRLGEGVEVEGGDVFGYLYGVARHVRQESHRSATRERKASERYAHEPREPQGDELDEFASARNRKALRDCLAALAPADADIALAYYGADGKDRIPARASLADRLGLTASGLRVRAYRLRHVLEDCVRQHLKGSETESARRPLPDVGRSSPQEAG